MKKEILNKAKLIAGTQVIKTFDEFIDELERILKEKEAYNNPDFWKKPFKLKFDSVSDQFNLKILKKHLCEERRVEKIELQYIKGEGQFKKVGGLLPYLKKCRAKKMALLLEDFNLSEEEVEEEYSKSVSKVNGGKLPKGLEVHKKGIMHKLKKKGVI